jgi:dihydropyrimidine dehydrogenase (NAD+) subunit PreT
LDELILIPPPERSMPKTPLTSGQLAENFADYHPNYTRDEALVESSRCLFCYDAPCIRACPTRIDIPTFIRQIAHDNVGGAAETIFDANILGGSCARACPTEVLCEGACVDQMRGVDPIPIGRLQRYATDYAMERNLRFFEAGPDTGKRIAIVGSGPAGLSCAFTLRRLGHAVTIFEARDVPGGLNTLGIAAYKISAEFSLAEIQQVLDIGVDLRLNTPVTAGSLPKILSDYDATFLAVGLGSTQRLNLPGEDLPGVWEALEFIYQMHRHPLAECEVGRQVVVLGCGNTAIDAATAAIRLGASPVTIAYRRSEAEKSAYNYEYDLGKADGVRFEWHAQPLRFVATDGKLSGVEFIRTRLVGVGGRKATLEPIPGTEFILPCDMAIKALGQNPVLDLLSAIPGVAMERGAVVIDRTTFATTRPGLFAGGDCTHKGKEIVNAVEDGKLAAQSIHATLSPVRS